ncbi:MAG: hypothetical protein MUP30_00430 [Deltaproteobacteria bacterium]|nr:hypothetical protein [Deltaproteobacteria bacterium]
MKFRLILQPAMAAIFAILAGLKDAREGRPPYLWSILTNPADRHNILRHGWKDVRKVFIVAFVLDVVYQLIVFHWVFLGQALLTAFVLAIVPYAIIRGLVTRITHRRTSQ